METQIGLIEQLNKSQANEFLNENMKAIEKAEKEMTKSSQLNLGRVQFYNNTDDWNVINDIISKYSDYITAQTDSDGFTTSIYFTGDATEAKEVLNDFLTDVRNVSDEINDENILNGIEKSTSASLNTAKEILDEYQDLYKQAQQARLVADESLYSSSDTQKTAIEWINEYTKAVENYNDAILSGDNSKISDAAMEFDTVNASIQDLMANSDMSKYADQIEEVRNQLNDAAIAVLNFENALDGTDTSDLGKQLKIYADDIKELNLRDIDFRIALETDGTQQGEESIRGLADAADEAGLSVDQLIDILTEFGYIQGEIANSGLDIEVPVSLSVSETIDQLNNQLKPTFDSLKSAYEDIFTADGFTLENVDLSMLDSIKSALDKLNEEENGITIDYSSFEELARVLTDTTSTADDVHNAINSLATDIVGALNPSIAECSGENYKLVQSLLESVGIINSEEVMISSLGYTYEEYIAAKEEATQAGFDLANATESEINAFVQEQIEAENCGEALALLQLKKLLVNGVVINTAADIQQILGLANSAGVAANALVNLANAKAMLEHATAIGDTRGIYEAKKYAREITSGIQNEISNFEMPVINFDPRGSNTKAAKSAGSKAGKSYKDAFKEEVDELESVISGITSLIGKQINAYSDSKDAAVSSLKEELNARVSVIEAQKEQLNNQVKLIDAQIKAKQKIIENVRAEIQAMKDANDQRQRELALQDALFRQKLAENQRSKLVYNSEKGFTYETDTDAIRSAKEDVDQAKFDIAVAEKEKQISLVEHEIDLLQEKKDLLDEQIDLLDAQISQITDYYNKLITETESYWDSLIKSMEDYKSRWQELSEIEDQAKLIAQLKELGITTDDITNMSAEAFEKFKDRYLAALLKVNEGNADVQNSIAELGGSAGSIQPVSDAIDNASSSMDNLSGSASTAGRSVSNTVSNLNDAATSARSLKDSLTDVSTAIFDEQTAFNNLKQTINEVIEAINDKITAIQEEQNTVNIATSSEMADFLMLRDKILEVKESIAELGDTVTDLDSQTLDNITNSFQQLYDEIILVSNALGSGIEGEGEGVTNSIASAIQALNEISLEEGIIAQFNNLKTAIDSVTSAISGGGESSGGEGQGSQSGSGNSGSESGSQGGAANSLSGAITEMGTTAAEVIGEPEVEGDGTVIGEFGSLKTAVNNVSEAIGIGGEEGSGDGGQGEEDGTLIGSINDLGTTSEEILGESGGDGVIGRFEEFRDVIGEANEHVTGISEGLASIDGQEVECTIKVNIETTGGLPGGLAHATGTALDTMNLSSAEYTAKYGKAHVEGTALVSGNWAVQSDEKNALMGEIGYEVVVRNGRFFTVGDNGAEMFHIKPGDIVFNHEQSKNLLENGHISGRGKAYADGTVGDKFASGVLRPLQPGDRMWDLTKKAEEYMKQTGEDLRELLSPVNAINRDMERMTQSINTISNIDNSNRIQNVTNEFHISLPNVNDSTKADALLRDLQSIALKKEQFFNMR